MKRAITVFLLLAAAFAAFILPYVLFWRTEIRTITIEHPLTIMGYYSLPGSYIDVIQTKRGSTPNTSAARVIAKKVFVVESSLITDKEGFKYDVATVRVTRGQAEALEQAQGNGILSGNLCRIEGPDSPFERVREALLGPRQITGADILSK